MFLLLRMRVRAPVLACLPCATPSRAPKELERLDAAYSMQAACRRLTELRILLWAEVAASQPALEDASDMESVTDASDLASEQLAPQAGSTPSPPPRAPRGGVRGLRGGVGSVLAAAAGLDVLLELEPEVTWEMMASGGWRGACVP